MDACPTAQEHYTTLQHFYETFAGDLSIHFPLWSANTRTLNEATLNAAKYMAEISHPAAGQYILDAGCGLGATAFWLAEQFTARVLGVSNAAENISRCRELAKDRDLKRLTNFAVIDLMNEPFADHTFDAVWNLESLNYLCPKQEYIQNTFRILKPGGVWVCMDRYCDVPECRTLGYGRVLGPLTTGFYTSRHWQGVSALREYMREIGFLSVTYLDLTDCILQPRFKSRFQVLVRSLVAMFCSAGDPRFYPAFLRAYRVVRSSVKLMEHRVMTYGLLSGVKPSLDFNAKHHSNLRSPPPR